MPAVKPPRLNVCNWPKSEAWRKIFSYKKSIVLELQHGKRLAEYRPMRPFDKLIISVSYASVCSRSATNSAERQLFDFASEYFVP
jgi:hypothetical protein